MRVLVVDDNTALLDTAGLLIEFFGHDVRTCSSSVEALEVATDYNPDIIFLDIGMPGIDGYELCRRLRATPRFAEVKIVAQSGYGDPENKQRAIDAGFDLHLLKPVSPDDLEATLAQREAELASLSSAVPPRSTHLAT